MEIKIVTINTWKCDGDYRNRLAILSGQLKHLAPDIIACQESFLSEDAGADTAASLAATLDMQYSFLACRPKKRYFADRWVDSYSGMTVLSRFPIVLRDAFDLPAIPEDPGRKGQQVALEFQPGKKMLVTNVHLTHLPGQTGLRKKQVIEVCKRAGAKAASGVEAETGDRTGLGTGDWVYSLICGDFNAGLLSAELALLKEEARAADTYVLGGGREPRTSLVEAFNVGRSVCVDYIFCLPVREAQGAAGNNYPLFKNAAVVLNEADAITGLYPSDHFGIFTILVTEP